MRYNLEESFVFVKNDNEWLKKLLIASGIAVLAFIFFAAVPLLTIVFRIFNTAVFIEMVVSWIIGIILSLSVGGFCIQAVHDRINNRTTLLPEWKNFWKFVFLGFKSAAGSLLFYLPVLAIGIVAGLFEAAAKINGGFASGNVSFFVNTAYNILYLIFMFFYFVFNANFLKDLNIFSYINVVAAYKRLKGNFVSYLTLVCLILALGVIFNLGAVLLILSIAGILLIPFAAIYVQLLTLDFSAQFLRITDKIQ